MIYRATYTHKGWLGLAPIHIGDPDGQMHVKVRWSCFEWWLDVNTALFGLANQFKELIDPAHVCGFSIRITGQLKVPITVEAIDD